MESNHNHEGAEAPASESVAENTESSQPPDPAVRLDEIFNAFARPGPTGADRSALCRFDLEGEGGGSFVVRVTPEEIRREQDSDALEPDITVALSVEDFLRLADGTFDGELALKSERIEISGDLELAAVFVELVNQGDTLGISRTSR